VDSATLICARLLRAGAVPRAELLQFLSGHGEVIEAGPLLELGIDGERMIGFIRREVLARLLAEREGAGKEEETPEIDGLAARILEILERLGGPAAMSDLVRETGARPERLRALLKDLIAAGRVVRTGDRGAARYYFPKSLPESPA
jgi:hypothetical protein